MKPKVSWFDTGKWAAVGAVLGGVLAAILTPDQASVGYDWGTIVVAACLAGAAGGGAVTAALKKRAGR